MAEFTHIDLKNARETQKIQRWKLAAAVNVSESTIERWESGETMPQPDDIDRVAEALGDPSIWHRWMLSNYDSYRKRYINAGCVNSLAALMIRFRYETRDVLELQDRAERDAIDGRIDDLQLKADLIKEVKEQIAASNDLLQELLK